MAKSDDLEQAGLEYWLTTGAPVIGTRPTTWFIALFTADPTDADITANEVDVVVDDTAYVRKAVTFGVTADTASNITAATIFDAVVYGSGAAPYDITHFGIYDASTVGNLLYHGALNNPKTLAAGEQANFDIGDINITEA